MAPTVEIHNGILYINGSPLRIPRDGTMSAAVSFVTAVAPDGSVIPLQVDENGALVTAGGSTSELSILLNQLLDEVSLQRPPDAIDEAEDGSVSYMGWCLTPGSTDSEAVWRVKKMTKTGTQQRSFTRITWADGDQNFDNVWSDRETLNYA